MSSSALPAAHPAERLRAHAQLRLPGQSQTRHAPAPLLSVAGCDTRTAGSRKRFLHRASVPQHETTLSNAKTLRASARSVSLWLSLKQISSSSPDNDNLRDIF